jgi:hypothetical protein
VSEPISTPLRVGAVILALVIGFFSTAIIAGAHDNVDLPTCHDVSHGKAKPSDNGDCFKGSERRANAGFAVAIAGGVAAAAAIILSIVLAATGRQGRLFLIAGGAAVAGMLLAIAVIHI